MVDQVTGLFLAQRTNTGKEKIDMKFIAVIVIVVALCVLAVAGASPLKRSSENGNYHHGGHHHVPNGFMDALFKAQKINYVVNIPSGAPPTNDGYAYSNLAYTNTTIYIAGQNGYDLCGNLVPLNPDGSSGDRIWRALANLKMILECFNEEMTQIPHTTVSLAALNVSQMSEPEQDDWFIAYRSLVNEIQRDPLFWGPKADVMARTIEAVTWLSRGDTFEVTAMPVPRTNNLPTCIDTGIPPPTALLIQQLDSTKGLWPCA